MEQRYVRNENTYFAIMRYNNGPPIGMITVLMVLNKFDIEFRELGTRFCLNIRAIRVER